MLWLLPINLFSLRFHEKIKGKKSGIALNHSSRYNARDILQVERCKTIRSRKTLSERNETRKKRRASVLVPKMWLRHSGLAAYHFEMFAQFSRPKERTGKGEMARFFAPVFGLGWEWCTFAETRRCKGQEIIFWVFCSMAFWPIFAFLQVAR